ncbi:hypothetical protein [Lonepinella sp. BR2357]|uniref:hypothetical protein n=1 Tax=Lonepinella sp. BR2357 TaxID=3434549 RepID=UPI003F6DE65F
MEKFTQFKQWLEKFMQSETFQKLLEKLKGIFTPVVTQVKQSAETNNLLRKLVNLVSQHKIITAVVAATVVVASSFVGTSSSKIEYPVECQGLKLYYTDMNNFTALRRLIYDEDPSLLLSKYGRIIDPTKHYSVEYTSENLVKLYQAHYEKLAQSSPASLNIFVENIKQDCKDRRENRV